MDWKEKYRNTLLDLKANPSDVRKIIKPHIPLSLYKYGSFQNTYWEKNIYKAKIYLSPAKSFNDPFDCRANLNYKKVIKKGKFRDFLLKQYDECDIDNITEEMAQECIIEGMREETFVFCFSEVWNSILMWAHYANNYNGYCIEYDMSKVRDHITYNLYPVLYEKDYIDVTDRVININSNVGIICSLVKAQEWNYEREWRIVEYRNDPFYIRKALKAVYLGGNCSQKNRKDIVQWAKDNNKEVYDIEISKTRYELERKRIV